MAQECGFFNAQMDGEDFDRVYLAEQFAAYFAAFIGNGVYGHSMQKLQVLCQDEPNMSIKVLSGEAYINGWWYRNKDTYNLQIPIADGVLSRIDVVVVRWGNAERDMWLQLIPGTPSTNPVKPAIRRDADYYDLQLATIEVSGGTIRITQTQIKDTRLDNSVCGLVTGVVDQIDTTNLYNQFESYFQDFKDKYEADYDKWTKEQKQAYIDYITSKQADYDKWTTQKILDYEEFVKTTESDYNEYLKDKKAAYDDFVSRTEKDYSDWTAEQKAQYRQWYETHTTVWTKEFTEWFESIKEKLSGDIAGNLQEQIDKQGEKLNEHNDRITGLENMVIDGTVEVMLTTSDGEILTDSDGNSLAAHHIVCPVNKSDVDDLTTKVEKNSDRITELENAKVVPKKITTISKNDYIAGWGTSGEETNTKITVQNLLSSMVSVNVALGAGVPFVISVRAGKKVYFEDYTLYANAFVNKNSNLLMVIIKNVTVILIPGGESIYNSNFVTLYDVNSGETKTNVTVGTENSVLFYSYFENKSSVDLYVICIPLRIAS